MGRKFSVIISSAVIFSLAFSPVAFAQEEASFRMQGPAALPVSFQLPAVPLQPASVLNEEFHVDISLENAMVRWIASNVSPVTGMPLSFQVLPEEKAAIYGAMGPADSVPSIIERVIVNEGLVIYDGAVGQIALTLAGGVDGLAQAMVPLQAYWDGRLGDLSSIRAGYQGNNFIYDPKTPDLVASDLESKGHRGFIYRIINANGHYLSSDPLDGKARLEGFPAWPEIHWEDWKPVAGENAWVVIAAMQLYHRKFYDPLAHDYQRPEQSVELLLSEELARAALLLQAETGGIRMAPIGTFRENEPFSLTGRGSWWYNQVSTENNLSWYAAFRMLYQVTGKEVYREAMQKMEGFFKKVYDPAGHCFYQGMNYSGGVWRVNDGDFAVDVQTWGILSLGAETIDAWFGEGTAYLMWQKAKEFSGNYDATGTLIGVGYTKEKGRVSVEWSAGAIMAARMLGAIYKESHADWSETSLQDADAMRRGMELLRRDLPDGKSAYAYSSRRGWIPFGWNSHDPRVMSLASTGWILFVDRAFNPFLIAGGQR